jgi:hypothetical protein
MGTHHRRSIDLWGNIFGQNGRSIEWYGRHGPTVRLTHH